MADPRLIEIEKLQVLKGQLESRVHELLREIIAEQDRQALSTTSSEEILTLKQAAGTVGRDVSTISKWRKDADVGEFKNGQWHISRTWLLARAQRAQLHSKIHNSDV